MAAIKIGSKEIGDGKPCFIVFEAGPTHSGFETAKELVWHAAKSGADAVKFQIIDPERLISDKKQLFSYDIIVDRKTGKTNTISEPLYDILKRRCLARKEWIELKQYCDKLGIVFFSTATYFDEVDFLLELGCETLKICSGDIDYFQFIKYCAMKGLCLQLDTGNATVGDIERAVDTVLDAGNNKIIIHNCPSGYPAKLESINLKLIPILKNMFQCPVAFSDHSIGKEMDIAAVAIGANMVEKTITLDRTTKSVEHIFSLEPNEMLDFVRTIREIEIAIGNTRRIMSKPEKEKAMAVRRSVVLKRNVASGETINEDMIDFARPGYGIRPEQTENILGKRLVKDMKKGQMLFIKDID